MSSSRMNMNGGSPRKKSSMDIIDQYLEEPNQAPVDEAQTPSLQIFRKAHRLKNKINAIQLASRLAKMKKTEDDSKKPTTEVFKQPPCLVAMMGKINKEKKDRKEIPNDEANKVLKEKLASSLFVEKIDMEDVHAVIENNHAGNYELQSNLRFDHRSGNLILQTKMTLKDDARGAMKLLDDSPTKHGKRLSSIITTTSSMANTDLVTGKLLRSSAVLPSREVTATLQESAAKDKGQAHGQHGDHSHLHDHGHSQHQNGKHHSDTKDRRHSTTATNSVETITSPTATMEDHSHEPARKPPVFTPPAKPALDHKQLLFPHVECLDGTIKAITHDISFRYFGDEGRVAFFEHYRNMCEATSRVVPSLDTSGRESPLSANSSVMGFDHEFDDSSFADGQSSAGRSLMSRNTHNTMHTGQAGSVVSFKSLFQKDDASASSTVKVASIMGKLSHDYYTTFESMVSKDAVKRSIDKEIFNHNSFKRYQLRPYVKPKTPGDASNVVMLDSVRDTRSRASSYGDFDAGSRSGKRRGGGSRAGTANGSGGNSRRDSVSSKGRADNYTYGRNLITRGRVVETDYSKGHVPTEAMALNALTPASPRTKYISGCIRESLQPMPNVILRKVFSTTHNLAHYGFGDKMGCVLAECLPELPHIEALNLADNNLTDVSLKHLIRAIMSIKTLQKLDLSRNKIDGESSDELAEYVSQPDCPLVRLTLQSADVDDAEADRFVQCLCTNKNILELDLSSNLLGTAEVAASGDATVKTGGVSLAEFISSASCKLQVLKVSWNSIRLRSAVRLAEAVAFNHTLTYLDLSANGMGYAAGEALGDAIMENRTLRTLLVNNNNFTSTACLSMCVGVVENIAMKQLSLNENPIGKAGASMIMQTSIVLGSRVQLSAASCNTIAIDERCWYDPGMPCRDYELHLEQPFHRAVAFHLLQTVATHSTLIFADISYEPPGNGKPVKLKLVQTMSKDREKYFDAEQKRVLKGLRLLQDAASNTKLGTELFYEADADNSGRLDKDELQDVLDKIGFTIDSERLQDIFAVFDVDGAGTIDLPEFISLLKSQHHEVNMRIREMLQYPIMAQSHTPTEKYVPPRTGVLRCSVVDGFVRKKDFYTITAVDQKYAFQMAKGIGDVLMMTDAVRNSKMRMNEAYAMYKMMYKEVGDKAEVLVKVLPQMMYPHEARQLVSKVTHDERIQLARLKAAFSVAVRPMFGAYNGYYCLDLSKELHRVCFARLLEQSQTVNAAKASRSIIGYGKVGDTSQHGNWTSFRNEFRNGQPVVITAQLFTPMPQSGILEFDFSGGLRPTGSELRLTDRRLCKVLQNLCLLGENDTIDAMRRLHSWQRRAKEKSQDGQLFMPMYRMSVEKALDMGLASDEFYEYLPQRRAIMRHASRREDIKVNFMKMSKDEVADLAQAVQQIAAKLENDGGVQPGDSFASAAESDTEEVVGEGEEEGEDVDEEEGADKFDVEEGTPEEVEEAVEVVVAAEDVAPDADEHESLPEMTEDMQLFMRQKKIKETKHRLHTLLNARRGVTRHAKASRFVEAIEEAFQQLWIMARHLALLVQLFQEIFGDLAKTKYFGSYCADIVVLLYSRVVDLHNFEIIWEVLDARDCACVVARIGLLNVFNPMKPDVTMELDLRRREERQVAKMIVYLSVDEPGINLNYKRFQWKREQDPIPGWDVTEPWFTEEGLPQHGKFAFTYYSGEGRNRNGCIPNVPLRKALTHMTLIDENEIIDENEMLPDELKCTAAEHFEEHRKVWLEYLAPTPDPAGNKRG